MTTEQVIRILKAHNDWRRGITDNPGSTPKELGEAIDVAIQVLREKERR